MNINVVRIDEKTLDLLFFHYAEHRLACIAVRDRVPRDALDAAIKSRNPPPEIPPELSREQLAEKCLSFGLNAAMVSLALSGCTAASNSAKASSRENSGARGAFMAAQAQCATI